MSVRRQVRVTGRVQGVGFRMFVTELAHRHSLSGRVANDDDGSVFAEVEGEPDAVESFVAELRSRGPGRVDRVEVRPTEPVGESGFRVVG